MSRLVASVNDQEPRIVARFHDLLDALNDEIPDLGQKTAVHTKAIPSFGNVVKAEKLDGEHDGRRDVDANWGVKKYRGKRKDGSAWEKIKHWFGYKLPLLVDSVYGIPLSYGVTQASTSDATTLSGLS